MAELNSLLVEIGTEELPPKGLPEPVRARLEDAIGKAMATAETRDALRNLGLEPVYLTGAEFARKWQDETVHYRQVVTDTGILDQVKSQNK